MKWVEISVLIDYKKAPEVSSILSRYAQGGSVAEEIIVGGEPGSRTVRAYILKTNQYKTIRETIAKELSDLGVDFKESVIEADDWLNTMKSYFKDQYVGEKFLIKPGWSSETSLPPDRIIIELDPGAAFGTGLHPTTRLCIVRLEKHVEGGMSVYDLGTGTGVLSIVAAKLDAAEIMAVDIDPAAVKSARQNVSVNQVGDTVKVERGTLNKTAAKKYREKFDIVTANITARAISDLSEYILAVIKTGGRLIASGIHKEGLDEVLIRLALAGFKLEDVDRMDKWYAVTACKSK